MLRAGWLTAASRSRLAAGQRYARFAAQHMDQVEARSQEGRLVHAARHGDAAAFDALTGPHLDRLRLHCYRMLGSLHDAEDALQETLLRAWLSVARFEERSTVGTWLYRIATNVCLNVIRARPRLVVPLGSSRGARPAAAEVPWLEPFPDRYLPQPETDGPEARVEAREATRLAFIAMMQLLPPRQRAVLVLRDVLAWSAFEVAAALDTSVPAVNSLLQRARSRMADRAKVSREDSDVVETRRDEQATIDAWVRHWEAADIDGLVRLLTDEAVLAMPPAPAWFAGPAEIGGFLRTGPNVGRLDEISLIQTRANGQPALAAYMPHPDGTQVAYGVMVFDIVSNHVAGFIGFSDPRLVSHLGLPKALGASGR
jgi:RNA polymerase sigma-70 factor (ECF subfamily)